MRDWRHWTPPAGSIPRLDVPDLRGIASVHLIGIGGAGMRNLARLFLARGIAVTGSDLKDAPALRELEAAGATVRVGHDAANVTGADAVVVSSAIADTNVELVAGRERGVAVWHRQQALAALSAGHRAIAVAGTHGKTTTTSMVAGVLQVAGLDPTYLVGGDLNESGSGARHGDGDLFVYEADESDGSFLLGSPWTGVVTNVEVDHVDFFPGGLDEIVSAFAEFAAGCERGGGGGGRAPPRGGGGGGGGGGGSTLAPHPGNDLVVSVDALGPEGARGRVRVEGEEITLALQVDGAHNLMNAAAAIAVARLAGVDAAIAAAALRTFEGVHRRFEFRGSARGADFFDDYGHNPTEMAVTIATARRRRPERLIALVQPHRYSRVRALWREMGESVAAADLVIVTDIYGAAQPPIPGVTGKLVVDGVQLRAPGPRTVYLPHRQDVVRFLDREVRPGDLVVTMGCGDVWMLGDAALGRIRSGEGDGVA